MGHTCSTASQPNKIARSHRRMRHGLRSRNPQSRRILRNGRQDRRSTQTIRRSGCSGEENGVYRGCGKCAGGIEAGQGVGEEDVTTFCTAEAMYVFLCGREGEKKIKHRIINDSIVHFPPFGEKEQKRNKLHSVYLSHPSIYPYS